MFDGLMTEGILNQYETTAFLEKMTNYINQKWKNLEIVITNKEHKTDIVMPDDWVKPSTDKQKNK